MKETDKHLGYLSHLRGFQNEKVLNMQTQVFSAGLQWVNY